MTCAREHRYLPDLEGLPESQAGPWRHKCAGCAYQRGYDDGFDDSEARIDPTSLEDSQAGAGRHKNARVAYYMGYYHGARERAQRKRRT